MHTDEATRIAASATVTPLVEPYSLLDAIGALLAGRRLVARVAFVCTFAAVMTAVLSRREFSSVGTFVPDTRAKGPSGAAGLAAQFGIQLPGSELGQSPEFYEELLRSREILGAVVRDSFAVAVPRRFPWSSEPAAIRGTLVDILGMREGADAADAERSLRELRSLVAISTGGLSGTVTVRVTTDAPELSRQIAVRLLALVEEFNRTRRQSQAAAERRFIDERLVTTRNELRQAENAQEQFLQRNRTFQNSPRLVFEHDRLQREVLMRQQVHTTLAQAYEQARIDEVRNTPAITIVEQPRAAALPNPRGVGLKGALALIGGSILGAMLAFLRTAALGNASTEPMSLERFAKLRRETVRDLTRPWRLLLGSRQPAREPPNHTG